MRKNQVVAGARAALEWKELVWQETIATDQLSDVLERFATAPELGRIVLEFRVDKKGAQWLIGSEPHRLPAIKDALVSHLPVRMVRARRTRKEMNDAAAIQVVGGHSLSSNKDRITAGIRALYGTVSRLQDGEQVAVQLMLGPRLSPAHWSPNGSPWLELLLAGGNTPRSRPNKVPVESRERHGFKVHIRLGATGSPARSAFLVRQVFGSFRTVETGEAKLRLGVDNPTRLHEGRSPWRWQQSLRSSELPVFAAWPAGEPPLPLIGSLHPKILAPRTELVRDPRNLGVTASVGTEEKFALPIHDALFHTVLVGPTGSAKSTVMLGLIEDAMTAGRGVIVFDPKGDLATDMLARVPTSRRDDVVVIDPTSTAPVGFNPLSGPHRLAHVTADSLLSIFESLFKDYWGIRTADILTAAFLTLSRVPEANLLWLQPFLTNPAFRKKVLKGQSDPLGTDVFWRQYDAKRPEAQAVEIAPVLNKLRQIILRPSLRATLGQSKPRFDIGDVITKRRIVVVNLNRGLLGGDAAKLVGTLLLGQLWSRLLARQGVPVERRHTIEVFIDEVHDFIAGIPGDLSDALAQARSLGGAFTMAHQYFSQLDPAMREAMNANARNKIYFGMNGLDAAIAAKQAPGLEPQDFMQLPKFHAYANVLQKGNSTDWVTIRTRPPSPARTDAGLIYAHSHTRYGTPAEQTEKELLELTDLNAEPEFEDATGGIGRVKR